MCLHTPLLSALGKQVSKQEIRLVYTASSVPFRAKFCDPVWAGAGKMTQEVKEPAAKPDNLIQSLGLK